MLSIFGIFLRFKIRFDKTFAHFLQMCRNLQVQRIIMIIIINFELALGDN